MFNPVAQNSCLLPAGGLLYAVLLSCAPPQSDEVPQVLALNAVSNQPYLLSGGDVLIEITTSEPNPSALKLTLNGYALGVEYGAVDAVAGGAGEHGATGRAGEHDVTSGAGEHGAANGAGEHGAASGVREHDVVGGPEPYKYRALVSGMVEGSNLIAAESGAARAELNVINYPVTGPIFSGPHLQPYLCIDELAPNEDGSPRRFAIGNGEFLDTQPQDEYCSYPTRVDYVYLTTGVDAVNDDTPSSDVSSSANANNAATSSEPEFKPLPDLAARPHDMAYTTTNENKEVPFIVRLETGTINRAVYQIAILHDPSAAVPTAIAPSSAWNARLIYTFGGGCEAGYFQGTATGGVLRENMLGKGYAVASSSLNVNAQGGCNDVVSAETAMMVKEHFIEHYGEPRYTIGSGASGGAMQQLLIAGAYPGILDGLLPSLSFADAVSYFTDSQECASLLRDYARSADLTEATRNAIGGWSMWSTCEQSLGERPKRIGPDDCPAAIPSSLEYDAETNPDGIRCSIYDGMRNVFGEKLYTAISKTRPFARAPHDNVGVQYGLLALNAGHISKELFLDLNENIGGWDVDLNSRPERTRADEDAVHIAYETGRIISGAAGLAQVPIIDDRSYLDHIGNFHASVYSFVIRQRLLRDNGHADNYILRRHGRDINLADENLELMDRWLANLAADTSVHHKLEKIMAARPAELQNDCFTPGGEQIMDEPGFDTARLFDNTGSTCNRLYPPHAGLRLVAGGPLSNDILKCQLKPVDYDDYAPEFSAAERARLEQIFPEGVCDWSKPGVGQTINQTWLSFGPSPVNRYRP